MKFKDKRDGSSKAASLIIFKAQTARVCRRCQPRGMSTLTHISERNLAGGGVQRAGGGGQLRGAIAVRHAHYGVGVASPWFASITV